MTLVVAIQGLYELLCAYNRGPALWEQACRPVIFCRVENDAPPVVGWMA